MADKVAEWALSFGKVILTTLLSWYAQTYDALGLTGVWIGALTISIVFSIFLVPLRGGGDLGKGGFGGFLKNKVNKTKGNTKNSGGNGG